MIDKPVAWRKVVGNVTKHYQYNEIGEGTPLYTRPAQTLERELLDKTILDQKVEIKKLRNVLTQDQLYELQRETMMTAKDLFKCGSSYDSVCSPSICDCIGKAQQK